MQNLSIFFWKVQVVSRMTITKKGPWLFKFLMILQVYVLIMFIDWVGGLARKIFGLRSWCADWAQLGLDFMAKNQMFSAWPDQIQLIKILSFEH